MSCYCLHNVGIAVCAMMQCYCCCGFCSVVVAVCVTCGCYLCNVIVVVACATLLSLFVLGLSLFMQCYCFC